MSTPSCKLAVKALPNALRNAVAGWLGDTLKVRIHAPALEDRANEELCDFIADTLSLPRRAVTLSQGKKSRQKVLAITGLTIEEATARLSTLATSAQSFRTS